MIIPDSFKQAYDIELEQLKPLEEEVNSKLSRLETIYPGVRYSSRIKTVESLFTKILIGRYEHPFLEMEDFFACRLVLPNLTFFSIVVESVSNEFNIVYTNRSGDKISNPVDFKYSDLHLHLTLKDTPLRRDKGILNRKFELQIKTFLQSALAEASHDIIYKPSQISWGTERVEAQLRALLELADGVLAQIEATANLLHAQSENPAYKSDAKNIIAIMEKHWKSEDLPASKRHMANIIKNYLDLAGIKDHNELDRIIQAAKEENAQVLSYLTIPPVQKVFALLYSVHKGIMRGKILSQNNTNRVLITSEMADLIPELRSLTTSIKYFRDES